MAEERNVIIGAGLSGAAVKYFLNSEDTLVLERSSKTGGLSRLENIFDCKINVAGVGHLRVSDQNKPLLEHVFNMAGSGDALSKPDDAKTFADYSAIWLDGKVIDFPVQTHLYQLPLGLRLRCLLDVFASLIRRKKAKPTNFRDWAIRQMGKTVANLVVLPHTTKTYQIDPAHLDPRSIADKVVGPSFWKSVRTLIGESKWRSQDSASSAEFYPMKSLSPIVQALLEKSKGEIWTGATVPDGGIDLKKRLIDIQHPDGSVESVKFQKLFSTIALPGLIDLMKDTPQDITLAAKYLDFSMMCETVLAFEGECPTPVRKLYIPSQEFSFQRLIFPSNFDKDCCPQGRYVVTAESCYHKGKKRLVTHPLFKKSIIHRTINELEKLELFNPNKILAARVFFIAPAYIIPDEYCMANRLKLINFLDEVDVVPVGRFAEWKTREIDSSLRRAWEVSGCPDLGDLGC